MKDIPVFATENGVASIFLKEIAYRQEARIRLLSSCAPDALLKECVDFCVACGAEVVYACGHDCLKNFPCFTSVFKMQRYSEGLETTDASLFPVQKHTAGQWRAIYNERMKGSPNASYMSVTDEKEMLEAGDAYFIHRDGELVGIGRIRDGLIRVVAACKKGGGRDVVLALAQISDSDLLSVHVADRNIKAMKLYNDLGFIVIEKLETWYCVKY